MGLSAEQVAQLLKPINPSRVMQDNKGMSHVSQQDVRAHLIRVFGFGGWSDEIVDLHCVRDTTMMNRNNKEVPAVTYLCRLRLTVRDPDGNVLASYEDVGTGTSPNLPDYGDAHDFAAKNAVSYALKRCATNLGDGFGLSLYNKGQVAPLVIKTLVMPGESAGDHDMQADVPQQVDMGDEAPAEPQVNDDDMQSARARVLAAARVRGWATPVLASEFEATMGGTLIGATVEQLNTYAGILENEA